MSNIPNPFKNGLKIVGTGLTAMLLNHISGDADFVKDLSFLGGGAVVALESIKLFTALAPNLINNWLVKAADIKNHDKNHDIENAFQAAYARTINLIEAECFEELSLKETFWGTFRSRISFSNSEKKNAREMLHDYFFGKLLDYFTESKQLNEFIENNYQLDLSAYIEQAFNDTNMGETFSKNFNEQITSTELISYFKASFVKYFAQSFVQELKNNDKAKTAYFKILLELTLERIAEVKQDTGDLKLSSAEIQDSLNILQTIALRTGNNIESILDGLALQQEGVRQITCLMPKVEEVITKIVAIKEEMEGHNCWVPNLVLSSQNAITTDKTNIFEYNTRYIPFLGRNIETSSLFNFLDSNDAFSWWMVEGPGGMGKSRLAMEFCFMAKQQGYYTGFYKLENSNLPDNDKSLGNGLPILMVIDYAMADRQKTITLLTYIHDKINTLKENGKSCCKVRILLLDRNFEKDWYDSIGLVKVDCYNSDDNYKPLHLQKQNEDIRWDIIEQVIEKETGSPMSEKLIVAEKNKVSILKKLEELDKQKRPLFAFFAGEALANDPEKNIRKWNIYNLLDAHLNRLKYRVWMKREGYKDYQHWINKLLVLNTLTRNLNKQEINAFLKQSTDLNSSSREIIRSIYYSIADQSNKDGVDIYYGLQPDILGEYFVLKTLGEYAEEDEAEVKELLENAWETKADQTSWMCSLMFEDYFVNTSNSNKLLEKLIFENIPENINQERAGYLATLFYTMIDHLEKESGSEQKQDKCLTYLRKLNILFNNNSNVVIQLGGGLSKIICRLTETDKIAPYLKELNLLYNSFNGLYLIRAYFAMTLVSMARTLENREERLNYVELLREINTANPGDRRLDLLMAMSIFLMIEVESSENLHGCITELRALYLTYRGDVEFATCLAAGLNIGTSKLENSHNQLSYLDELRSLYTSFYENEDIAQSFSSGIVNIIGKLTDAADGITYLNELRGIHASFPTDRDITINLEKALVNIINRPKKTENISLYFVELQKIYSSFQNDSEAALYFSMGLCGMTAIEEREGFLKIYIGELNNLHLAFINDKEITLYLAMGLVNVTCCLKNAEDMHPFLQQLRSLQSSFSSYQEITLQLNYGIANIVRRIQDIDNILPYISELRKFSAASNYHREITLCLAQSLVSTTYRLTKQGNGRPYMNELLALYSRFKGDYDFGTRLANGIINLTAITENEDELLHYINELRNLYEFFKEDDTIAGHFANGLSNVSVMLEPEKSLLLIKELEILQTNFRSNLLIARHFANSLVNLNIKLEKTADQLPFVDKLRKLFLMFPEDREVALLLAKGLVVVTRYSDKSFDLLPYLKELRLLNLSFKNDIEFAKLLAGILYFQTDRIEDKSDKILYVNELNRLCKMYANGSEFALLLSLSTANLTYKLHNSDDLLPYIVDLRNLNLLFTTNSDIALSFAKGLCNILLWIGKDGEFLTYLGELRTLYTSFKDNIYIAQQFAKGVVDVIYKLGNVIDVFPFLGELRLLNKAFAGDNEISLSLFQGLGFLINLEKTDISISETKYLPEMVFIATHFPHDEGFKIFMALAFNSLIENTGLEKAEKIYLGKIIKLQLSLPDNESIKSILTEAKQTIISRKSLN